MMISKPSESIGEQKSIDQFLQSLVNELEHVKQRGNEVRIMMDQTQTEINKLTQRNTVITTKLQQIQALIDSAPREDIQAAYDSALDGQQRLLRMRGQLEKLQSDQAHLATHEELLKRILEMEEIKNLLGSGDNPTYIARGETVEMMIQAQESERQKLARQMHDGPAQALSNFILQTEIAMRLFDIDQGKAREELINLKVAATSSFQKVRDFIFELRPMMLDDLGLGPTLTRYIEFYKDQTKLDIQLTTIGLERRLVPYLEVMIFRALQELLGNIYRHSQGTQAKLMVDASDDGVRVSVEDNGKGFDQKILTTHNGMGIKIIRDRVEMLGGNLEIHSVLDQGCHIQFLIPASSTGVFV